MDTDKPVTTEDKAADAEKSSDKSAEESVTMSSGKMLVIKNAWKNTPDKAFPATLNLDECPPLRGYTGTYLDFHVEKKHWDKYCTSPYYNITVLLHTYVYIHTYIY